MKLMSWIVLLVLLCIVTMLMVTFSSTRSVVYDTKQPLEKLGQRASPVVKVGASELRGSRLGFGINKLFPDMRVDPQRDEGSALPSLNAARKDQGGALPVSIPPKSSFPVAPMLSVSVSPTDQISSPKLHVTTYATHGGRDDRFCRAVESSIRSGIDLVILGWGEKWHGLSQKLEAAHQFAADLPVDDLLLFTDAYDVLFLDDGANIVKSYQSFVSGTHRPIIFSGECGCWPHVMVNRKACFSDYPKAPTPYRYLNSGTWIGPAGQAKDMLNDVMVEAGSDFRNANDQKLVADMYIAGKHGIELDFYNKIFQSMHMTLDRPLPRCNPVEDVKMQDGRWRNTLTGNSPAVVHFNGGGKTVHLKMEGVMWWKSATYKASQEKVKLSGHRVKVPNAPNGTLRFDELCRDYMRNY